jgi:hypothetical protein
MGSLEVSKGDVHVQKISQVGASVMVRGVGQHSFSNGHVASICRRLLHLRDLICKCFRPVVGQH